ncbi:MULTISPECIES: FtsX-like permease family protein [unclassified Helicobacter]|uniref:FtsX-like permease family protein n=1 Tax=unclassified Helicobacter TaxID=2593540 RepID=UPI0009EDB457|nr:MULTISPECIES: FtsX-like permease family protein [unclassified Helicobacter]
MIHNKKNNTSGQTNKISKTSQNSANIAESTSAQSAHNAKNTQAARPTKSTHNAQATQTAPQPKHHQNTPTQSIVSFLHKRFLRFDRSQPFISITAILAFLGIGIGVMVLIVAMAIMNGMSKEFEKRLFVMSYPLTMYPLDRRGITDATLQQLESRFPNFTFSPYLYTQAVSRINDTMEAAIVFGVDPAREARINSVYAKAIESSGTLERLEADRFSIIIGESVARANFLEHGDKITLYFTKLEPTGLVLSPVMKRFNLQGEFSSGIGAYDSAYMYTSLDALARIKNIDNGFYDGVHIASKEPMKDIEALREYLREIGVNAALEGWWQKNANLFAAMDLEKQVLFIVLMLIILMASLNIISSLLMVVMNRRKEIALLLSMGASKQEVKKTFFLLGVTIGLGGIVLGVVLSFVAMWILATFPIISLPADVYGTSQLPLDLSAFDFGATILGAIIIVCLSSYYPAKKASQIDALSVLRNE